LYKVRLTSASDELVAKQKNTKQQQNISEPKPRVQK